MMSSKDAGPCGQRSMVSRTAAIHPFRREKTFQTRRQFCRSRGRTFIPKPAIERIQCRAIMRVVALDVLMSEQWNFYPLLVDGEPASIFVDLGIAKVAPLAEFPNMAYLRVRMNNPRDDGLSSQEEYGALIAMEKCVTDTVERGGKSIYVGRNTSGGNRDFYFYTHDDDIEEILSNTMDQWPTFQFQTGIRADSEWSSYWNFLHPSAEDLQKMGNREVIDRLLENGDHIDRPRKIDHFAVFKTRTDRERFAQYIMMQGYSVLQAAGPNDGGYQIAFDRTDRPDQIDDITIDLYRNAKANNGEYDGWGCLTEN